jgi:hypothetical protein
MLLSSAVEILLLFKRLSIAKRRADRWLLWRKRWDPLHKNQTWDLVELLERKRAIGCKWVFKKKETTSEKRGEKFKARLVAKGLFTTKRS